MKRVVLAVAVSVIPVLAAAYQVVPVSLDKLVEKADQIFVGKCIDRKTEIVVEKGGQKVRREKYTFEVDEVFKGDVPLKVAKGMGGKPVYVVTQSRPMALMSKTQAMPYVTYEMGQKYILFLSKAGKRGDRYPLGYGLSVFTVRAGKVSNQYGNLLLFKSKGLKVLGVKSTSAAVSKSAARLSKTTAGPVDYNDFVKVVKALAK